jgi:hypothetical protein
VSLIFDDFPSRSVAEGFVATVKRSIGLDGQVFDTVQEAFEHDPYPFGLQPPIVHIDRSDDQLLEARARRLVGEFGGQYAGT